jgi:hypothetical protein
MERFIPRFPRFPRLLFCRLIHQSNQKISAQSILLSLNHTHPIQSEMPLHLVINIPRESMEKYLFLAVEKSIHSSSSSAMAPTNAR